jgi:hypothetical protein
MSLDLLRERLQKTKQLAAWIASATEKAAEFPSDVVQKVVDDYSTQYEAQLPGLLESAEVASTERQSLADQAEELDTHKAEVEANIDEFRLRHVIGELSESEFAAREEEARESIDEEALVSARAEISSIDELLSEVGELQNKVGSLLGDAPIDAAEESVADLDIDVSQVAVAAVADDEVAPASDELGEAAYAAGNVADAADADDGAADADDGAGDEWEVDAVAAPGTLGPDSDSLDESGVESLDVMPGADSEVAALEEAIAAVEVEVEANPESAAADGAGADGAESSGEGPRLSVTMPGSPGPELFPFTGDVMSLGRGRNNDIQIKNDGKISRYHCRIFRRGDEFIVEDNKSSNGTLVDGKLVTRQPLTGGELVQIGETRVEFLLR